MRLAITEAFGCPLRNSYGASEFLSMGWECAQGQLHLNSDWVILEPVDARHRPVPPSTVSHTTLLTNLANHVQPLVRYDLGDQLRMADAPCACGSPLPAFEVQGRQDDVLVVPGREGGPPVSLLPLALCTVLEDEAAVFDFVLVQQAAGDWHLRLAAGGTSGRTAAVRARHTLAGYLRRMGAEPVQLSVETGCVLPRGRSGKARRILREAAS